MPKVWQTKNGIKVILAPGAATKAVTVMAMFPVGSRYEDDKIAGASHFVEHLLFKGTKKRPQATDISRDLDACGAEYNAFTDKDYTGYYIKISAHYQRLAYDILSDMIFASKLDEDEIKREKGVIIEEMRMYEDNPSMAVDSEWDKVMYGKHSLGRDIIGSKKTITEISRDELWRYYQKAYAPDQMTLVISGAINKATTEMVKKYFGEAAPTGVGGFKVNGYQKFIDAGKKLSLDKRVEAKKRNIDQAHLIMGFPGLKYTDKQKYTLGVLLAVLSGGMSSRLFVEVRERRGLAYMVRAGHEFHRDGGAFYVRAGLDPARLQEAVKVIGKELGKMTAQLVDAKELRRAKSNLTGSFILSQEDSSHQAMYFAKTFLFSGKVITPAEYLKRINKVTAAQVMSLAKKLFKNSDLRLAVISPFTKSQIMKVVKEGKR